mmetsp:Transcript_14738/g.30212  ORF Transcript_14738/g.30212 Transcript_14738/m.30212 type:complete len:125 (+) Transcript_14738:805-1179(+)
MLLLPPLELTTTPSSRTGLGTTVAATATITSLGSIQLLTLPLFTSLLVYPARISFAHVFINIIISHHQTCLSPCSLPITPHRIEATQMQRIILMQFFASMPVEQHHLAQLHSAACRRPPEKHQF